jgi:DNA-binding LacI/PurR family transcriptional regulator
LPIAIGLKICYDVNTYSDQERIKAMQVLRSWSGVMPQEEKQIRSLFKRPKVVGVINNWEKVDNIPGEIELLEKKHPLVAIDQVLAQTGLLDTPDAEYLAEYR